MIAHLQNGQFEDKQILKPGTAKLMHSRLFGTDDRLNAMAYGFTKNRVTASASSATAAIPFSFTATCTLFSMKMWDSLFPITAPAREKTVRAASSSNLFLTDTSRLLHLRAQKWTTLLPMPRRLRPLQIEPQIRFVISFDHHTTWRAEGHSQHGRHHKRRSDQGREWRVEEVRGD